MLISNDCDDDVVVALHTRIQQAIAAADAANPKLTHLEITLALLETLGTVLLNIRCPHCRQATQTNILSMLPAVLNAAAKEAGQFPQSQHLH